MCLGTSPVLFDHTPGATPPLTTPPLACTLVVLIPGIIRVSQYGRLDTQYVFTGRSHGVLRSVLTLLVGCVYCAETGCSRCDADGQVPAVHHNGESAARIRVDATVLRVWNVCLFIVY